MEKVVWGMGEDVKEKGLGGRVDHNKCIELSNHKILRTYEVLDLLMKSKLSLEEPYALVLPLSDVGTNGQCSLGLLPVSP